MPTSGWWSANCTSHRITFGLRILKNKNDKIRTDSKFLLQKRMAGVSCKECIQLLRASFLPVICTGCNTCISVEIKVEKSWWIWWYIVSKTPKPHISSRLFKNLCSYFIFLEENKPNPSLKFPQKLLRKERKNQGNFSELTWSGSPS